MNDKNASFIEWLNGKVTSVGSIRELSRQAQISHTSIADVLSGSREPTYDFVVAMARWANEPLEKLLQMAGLLPRQEITETTKKEILHYFKQLDAMDQARIIVIAKALAMDGKHKKNSPNPAPVN